MFKRTAYLAVAVSALWLAFLFVGAAVNASQAIAGAHAVASR